VPNQANSPQRVIEEAVATGKVPGAVAAFGTADGIAGSVATGFTNLLVESKDRRLVSPDTLFDLASLTKVVATLPAILRLIAEGRIRLEEHLGKFFPEASPTLARVSVRQLLSHSSGLPSGLPLYLEATNAQQALRLILRLVPSEAGHYSYSDLGMITLGALVERVSGKPLDSFVTSRVLRPLGMEETRFGPASDRSVAATELCRWRGRVIEGEVHDENAYAMGGTAGHAGLFGTAADLARYAQAWLRLDERLGPKLLLRESLNRQLEQDGVRRGLGWMLNGEGASVGDAASEWAFGHTGFTGTSLWCDPKQGWFGVLLTNRVHPSRERPEEIQRLRNLFYSAVARTVSTAA
jgi:CubicO group peptidase (beta-lactamase class C family)